MVVSDLPNQQYWKDAKVISLLPESSRRVPGLQNVGNGSAKYFSKADFHRGMQNTKRRIKGAQFSVWQMPCEGDDNECQGDEKGWVCIEKLLKFENADDLLPQPIKFVLQSSINKLFYGHVFQYLPLINGVLVANYNQNACFEKIAPAVQSYDIVLQKRNRKRNKKRKHCDSKTATHSNNNSVAAVSSVDQSATEKLIKAALPAIAFTVLAYDSTYKQTVGSRSSPGGIMFGGGGGVGQGSKFAHQYKLDVADPKKKQHLYEHLESLEKGRIKPLRDQIFCEVFDFEKAKATEADELWKLEENNRKLTFKQGSIGLTVEPHFDIDDIAYGYSFWVPCCTMQDTRVVCKK